MGAAPSRVRSVGLGRHLPHAVVASATGVHSREAANNSELYPGHLQPLAALFADLVREILRDSGYPIHNDTSQQHDSSGEAASTGRPAIIARQKRLFSVIICRRVGLFDHALGSIKLPFRRGEATGGCRIAPCSLPHERRISWWPATELSPDLRLRLHADCLGGAMGHRQSWSEASSRSNFAVNVAAAVRRGQGTTSP